MKLEEFSSYFATKNSRRLEILGCLLFIAWSDAYKTMISQLLTKLHRRKKKRECVYVVTVSGIVSIRAVYGDVTRTSYGRNQRGSPAS